MILYGIERKRIRMRKKTNALIFLIIAIINSVLCFLFYKSDLDNNQKDDIITFVVIYFSSLVVYWFFYLVYYIEEKLRINRVTCNIFALFSALAIILLIIKVKTDTILFFPLMYMFSLLGVSVFWSFFYKQDS